MRKVYTKPDGYEVRIGACLATNDAPALVPDDVAAHLEQTAPDVFRVERDEPAPRYELQPRLAPAVVKATQKVKED